MALHRRASRFARRDPVLGGELVGDEAVAEDRIVGMDLAGGMDEVCVGPVPIGHRVGSPRVEALALSDAVFDLGALDAQRARHDSEMPKSLAT